MNPLSPQDDNLTNLIDQDFVEEVRTGLTRTPKRLSSRFFYDAEGSRLFQQIMHLPEYYLTRSEFEILSQYKAELLALFLPEGGSFELIELGAGDGLKTKVLLDHFQERQARFSYIPIDISSDALNALTDELRRRWPDLSLQPRQGDYFQVLSALDSPDREGRKERRVILFLGSNIGNFSQEEAVAFYRRLRELLQPGDLILTGFDLQKHPAVIQAAYDDKQGLTRAFNLNLLRRINRELNADFDLTAFDHYETYNPETGEARSYLVSKKEQQVRIEALAQTVTFGYAEVIHTEISRKYTRPEIDRLASATGFVLTSWFTDCKGYFADVVYERQSS